MTKIRNKTLLNQVMIRDLGLCRCCGFKACECHHIIPLIYNGEDRPRNMVALCSTCHIHSPDTKQEFFDYMKIGGARTQLMLGKIVQSAQKLETDSKGEYSFSYSFDFLKEMIKSLREIDINNCLEKYNFKESLEVENVNFSDCVVNCDKNELIFTKEIKEQ